MSRSTRRGRIPAGEMFPARETGYRSSSVKLASGIKIRVVERGDSAAQPVLLLPGWGSTIFVWRHNMRALAEAGFRAVAVDLKGMGLSDKPLGEHEYTSEAMLAHLREILAALGLKRPVIAGHSLSASIAYRFARKHSGETSAIVLVSPVGHAGVKLLWLFKALTPGFLRRIVPVFANRLFVIAAMRRGYGTLRRFTSEEVDQYCAATQFPGFAIAQRDLLHAFGWNQAVDGPVNVPLLLISGSRDHMVGAAEIDAYARHNPHMVVRTIADAGHIVPEEAPDQVNRALLEFLRQLQPRTTQL